jgi:hypothetical protein
LHRQAARHLQHEHPGLSLQTTDLIHKAYLRLIDQQHVGCPDRSAAGPGRGVEIL